MIGRGGMLTRLTGHRKATTVYCGTCLRWVDTPRGLMPDVGHAIICPDHPITRVQLAAFSRSIRLSAPAFIPAHRLGSRRRSPAAVVR